MKVIDVLNIYNFRFVNNDEEYKNRFEYEGMDSNIVRLCDFNDSANREWLEIGIYDFGEEKNFEKYLNSNILNTEVAQLSVINNELFIFYDEYYDIKKEC